MEMKRCIFLFFYKFKTFYFCLVMEIEMKIIHCSFLLSLTILVQLIIWEKLFQSQLLACPDCTRLTSPMDG